MNDEKKLCRACKNEIEKNAVICNTCGSYQKFLTLEKIVNANDLTLGLILGFISLLMLCSGWFSKFESSKLMIDIIKTHKTDKLSVIAYNKGNNPVVILDGGIKISSKKKNKELYILLDIKSPKLIKPGEYEVFDLETDLNTFGCQIIRKGWTYLSATEYESKDGKYLYECELKVNYQYFEKEVATVSKTYPCVPDENISRIFSLGKDLKAKT